MQPHACRKVAAGPTASARVGGQLGRVCLQCCVGVWTRAIQLLRKLLQELLRHQEHADMCDMDTVRELEEGGAHGA